MSNEASKTKGLIWLVGGIVLPLLVSVGIKPLIHMIPWSWEKSLAGYIAVPPPGKSCHADKEQKALLKKLSDRIYPLDDKDKRFSIDVKVVKEDDINAYAQLGGEIVVFSGLLNKAQSPAEIAGVLAHEIEHVRQRHIWEGVVMRLLTHEAVQMVFSGGGSWTTDWAKYYLDMGFTRSQESAADEGALVRLQKAHVDNKGFKDFFARMDKASWAEAFLSDHPDNEARAEMADSFENKDVKPIMTKDEWGKLKRMCK